MHVQLYPALRAPVLAVLKKLFPANGDCECLSRISANSGASYGSQSQAWLPGHCTGREIFDALLETFLVASLGGPIVVPPSDPREGVIGPLTYKYNQQIG